MYCMRIFAKPPLLFLIKFNCVLYDNHGLTNGVSGRPGQPEKGSGQPELGVWLPSGQPRFPTVIFLNISNVSLIPLKQ